jgi:MFS family permease
MTETYSRRLQASVYGTAFFNSTVQSMASTIIALLIVALVDKNLGFLVGMLISARQFLTVTMSVYAGSLMDNFGTKRVIIAFGAAGVVSSLAYPSLAPLFGLEFGASGANPGLMFILAIMFVQMFSGYAEATSWIGSQTLVGQIMKGNPVYTGRMTFVARIGGFLGPPAIGYAWDFWGPWGGFGFLAVWIAGGMIAAAFLPNTRAATQDSRDAAQAAEAAKQTKAVEDAKQTRSTTTLKKQSSYGETFRLLLIPTVMMVVLVTVMRQTGSGVQSSFYIVWLSEHIGIQGSTIGWLVGAANAASAAAALSTGPLMKRYAAHWLLILMIAISIIAIAITPLLGREYSTLLFVTLLGAICVRGYAQGLNLPLMMSILSQNVAPHLQGRVTGLRISFNRFGGLLVPPGMGALADYMSRSSGVSSADGLASAFYIVGIAGVVALAALSVWVAMSPSFKKET